MRGLESRKDAEERVNRLWPIQDLKDFAVPFLAIVFLASYIMNKVSV